MAKFIRDYLLFILKSATIILLFFGVSLIFASFGDKSKNKDIGSLIIKDLRNQYYDIKNEMINNIYTKTEAEKLTTDIKNSEIEKKGRTFVIKFDGDIQAKAVDSLKKEITAILSIADHKDNVVLMLESPGGTVNGYGLAASELERLTAKGLYLTVLVDKVAASGGYMMAVIADKIIAAPFAIIGSIGVLVESPNFNELLEKRGVKYEQITSGKYKKTISILGKNTEEGRQKVKEELNQIHRVFKSLIKKQRPNIDIEKISTGEFWLGTQAKELGLVYATMTSTNYLTSLYQENKNVYLIKYERKVPFAEKLINSIGVVKNMINQDNISSTIPMLKN
ncbi:protease SohB [Rickettsiales endosymbiont of Trichoplax sp. H2]|uniref:protease SohB n=1 Tax=Rickettsiales endosymbiont of Trichoplax sp. H2 TaxID=2021221 RepID=UPI0012B40F00|nr:protease SohB [Rickettsiales endosymbiont of Trichoplax sp. H2]MSO14377.1 putative protease SohB [Rickettsiales endosymbiont of Trichoplax sp. H2]